MFFGRLIITALTLLLAASTMAAGTAPRSKKKADEFVVVIDAGHGGRDFGAVGSKTNEKSINLAVARLIRDYLGEDAPEIKTVMTRSDDRFVSLSDRAAIANKAGGNLFVSIHTNSVDKKNPNRKSVAGASVYTLGVDRSAENLAVAMRENAVMTLEADYTTNYEGFDPNSAESYIIFEMDRDLHMEQSISAAQSVQNELIATADRDDRGVRQAGFLVLRATSMPAILVELDFICNPRQEEYMASADGQKQLGRAVADGILVFSDEVARAQARITGASIDSPRKRRTPLPIKAKEPTEISVDGGSQELADVEDSVFYRIQFMTLPRTLDINDKRLSDLPDPVRYYRHSGSIKYVCGRYASESEAMEALSEVKRRYKDAFVIRTRGASRL